MSLQFYFRTEVKVKGHHHSCILKESSQVQQSLGTDKQNCKNIHSFTTWAAMLYNHSYPPRPRCVPLQEVKIAAKLSSGDPARPLNPFSYFSPISVIILEERNRAGPPGAKSHRPTLANHIQLRNFKRGKQMKNHHGFHSLSIKSQKTGISKK